MPQLLLQGFPEGVTRIGSSLSVLDKEGMRTYFIGIDNYFSHPTEDAGAERFAMASLMANSHMHACEITRSPLAIPHRTLMNWTRQLAKQGASSFFAPRTVRGSMMLTPDKITECEERLRLVHFSIGFYTFRWFFLPGESDAVYHSSTGSVFRDHRFFSWPEM